MHTNKNRESDRGEAAWISLVLILMVATSVGCAPFTGLNRGFDRQAVTDTSRGVYRVEMTNMFGAPTVYDGTIDEQTTVQTALENSGAIRKYRDMDVSILRIVEETGKPLKMVVDYRSAKKSVRPEQDYALLPGDRVLVEAQQNSLLDRLSGSSND